MILSLFLTFLKIGLLSIGGGYAVIPMIQEEVVNMKHWLNESTFADIITISQMTPGPLAVNTSTFVGIQIAGIPGAVCASLGCILAGAAISLTLYRFFSRRGSSGFLSGVLNGLKAASVGLIFSAAATILMLAFWGSSDPQQLGPIDLSAVLLSLFAFLLLRLRKAGPILLMAVTGFLGLILYL